jgi:5-methylthioadenosine/S-adenosylhomocysteine deaminase
MSPILFKNVRVLAIDAAESDLPAADVRIEGNIIQAMGTNLEPGPGTRVIDGRGKLLMPGLINGHFHSPGNLNRGAIDDMPLELFMLYEVPPFDCPPLSPRLNYVRTLLGAAEMLKSGVTAVHDDPFYIPSVSMDLIDAAMNAYADSGIRATVSINMPNVVEYEKYPFLFDLFPDEFREKMRAGSCRVRNFWPSTALSFPAGTGPLRAGCEHPFRVRRRSESSLITSADFLS